jgi:hypothetical protein
MAGQSSSKIVARANLPPEAPVARGGTMSAETGFPERKDVRKMFWFRAVLVLTLVLPMVGNGRGFAVSPAFAGEGEKTVPQGEDPPGSDDEQPIAPPAQKDGVITPPPIGDEGIHTDVPNPNAGHKEEVIPPPDDKQSR